MKAMPLGSLGLVAAMFLALGWAAAPASAQGFSFGFSTPGVSVGVGGGPYGVYGGGYPIVARPPLIVQPVPTVIVRPAPPVFVRRPIVVGPRYSYGPRVVRRTYGPRYVYRNGYRYPW